jgi:hypothetical protein
MALLPENRTSGEFFFNCLPLPLVKSLERVVRYLHIHSSTVIYRLIPKSIFCVGSNCARIYANMVDNLIFSLWLSLAGAAVSLVWLKSKLCSVSPLNLLC